jgi:hypothetical protein
MCSIYLGRMFAFFSAPVCCVVLPSSVTWPPFGPLCLGHREGRERRGADGATSHMTRGRGFGTQSDELGRLCSSWVLLRASFWRVLLCSAGNSCDLCAAVWSAIDWYCNSSPSVMKPRSGSVRARHKHALLLPVRTVALRSNLAGLAKSSELSDAHEGRECMNE